MSAQNPQIQPDHRLEDEPDLVMTEAQALPWYFRHAVTPVPVTTSRAVMAMWFMKQQWLLLWHGVGRFFGFLKRHPWLSLGGVAAVFGCGALCQYFGATVLAGGVWYAVQHRETPPDAA